MSHAAQPFENKIDTGRRSTALDLSFVKSYWLVAIGLAAIIFLVFFHLTSFPTIWFDEGSHLHVPKTLVNLGVYADYSSEGFRYYGPTTGVGPTVFLPIALVFRLFGIGLLQARLVIALYLCATIYLYFRLSKSFGGMAVGVLATALVVSSRGVSMLEYGRQVLGEVPGFFFILSGLLVWFYAWEQPSWKGFLSAGVLMGLSLVTKNQYLILIGPGLGIVFLANLLYYKAVPNRAFVITGSVTVLIYLAWQVYQIFFLGPSNASQNWAMFRQATADSALIFSPALMKSSISQLLNLNVYLGILLPGLIYGVILSIPRRKEGLKWSVLLFITLANLTWYVLASIGWIRYAFPALAISGLFVAKMFYDLAGGFHFDFRAIWNSILKGAGIDTGVGLKMMLGAWAALMVFIPLGQNIKDIVLPPLNAPQLMAAYMNAHVDKKALVETWEPEMGFLSDHNYHFPPAALLYQANSFIWLGKAPPSSQYHFVQTNLPDYVLTGSFSSWVQLYPADFISANYTSETAIGGYQLYKRK